MTPLQTFLTHVVVDVVVVAAAVTLCVTGHIPGDSAVGMIAGILGISLGAGTASIGALSTSPAAKVTGPSSGTGAAPAPGG